VLHQTLRRGYLAGLAASLAPFVSDGPIIVLAFTLLNAFEHTTQLLSLISLTGALYLLWLAWRLFHSAPHTDAQSEPGSFLTAVKINLLNPAPYLFWLTVGGSYLLRGDLQQAILFIVFMLGTLALGKFALAASVRKLGHRFSDGAYSLLLKLLAVALSGFALKLALDAWQLWRQTAPAIA